MGIIQCAASCKYQKDGYCELETCSTVNSVGGICPHFIERSSDNRDSLGQGSDAD